MDNPWAKRQDDLGARLARIREAEKAQLRTIEEAQRQKELDEQESKPFNAITRWGVDDEPAI